MTGGYMGKMLFVDLSSKAIEERDISEELAMNFIGGYGIGVKILYDMMKPGVDPLGPENILGFLTGPATGSGAMFGSRFTLVCKSPVTGGWNDANSGGYFGKELKKAGYDAVFITGASEHPVYLWIKDGKAEIRDAGHLWGKDTKETLSTLIEEIGDKKIRASIIGPAGEKISLISCPINEGHRAPARGGSGAVMGSKKLKAVVVRGNADIPAANPAKLREINQRVLDFMKNEMKEGVAALGEYGTGIGTAGSALDGNSPVKNWGGIGIIDYGEEAAKKLNSTELDKYKVKKYACSNCPLGCGAEYIVKSGRWPIGQTERPEYETASAFGSMLLNSDADSLLKLNEICNRSGLDTISTGATVAWAMECYNKGILSKEDLDGIELTWGNSEAIVNITEKIANHDGCGAILALGSDRAAKKWNKGIEYVQAVLGIEFPMHDPKFAPGFGRTYQFDPTPSRHVKGGLGHLEEVGLVKNRYNYCGTGFLDAFDTFNKEFINSAGFCLFSEGFMPEGAHNEYIEALTGWPFRFQQVFLVGRRILCMRQAFNLREGLTPADFVITPRAVGSPPQTEGPLAGITVDNDHLGRNFYHALDWEWETGKPKLESLIGLGGLDAVIKDLYGDAAL
ncbi:MAG: aldehyde ferredoxin oxidoreductase family protein [Deltaproteobacteria bacterium]|nr:aldehyde ferredoxin oxidoreductase family protein [Deltaproteobacteria bacterium]